MDYLDEKDIPVSDIKQPKLNRNRRNQCICKTCKEIRTILPLNSCKPGFVKRIMGDQPTKEDGSYCLSTRTADHSSNPLQNSYGDDKHDFHFYYDSSISNGLDLSSNYHFEENMDANEYYKGMAFENDFEERYHCYKNLNHSDDNFHSLNASRKGSIENYSESRIVLPIGPNERMKNASNYKFPQDNNAKNTISDKIEYFSNLWADSITNSTPNSRQINRNKYQKNNQLYNIDQKNQRSPNEKSLIKNEEYNNHSTCLPERTNLRSYGRTNDSNEDIEEFDDKAFTTKPENDVCNFLGKALQYSRKFSEESFEDAKISDKYSQDRGEMYFPQMAPDHSNTSLQSESLNATDFMTFSEDSIQSTIVNTKLNLSRNSFNTSRSQEKSNLKNPKSLWNDTRSLSIIPLLKKTSSQPREALKEYIYSSNYLKNRNMEYDDIQLDEDMIKEYEDYRFENAKNFAKEDIMVEPSSESKILYGSLNLKLTPVPSSILLK